MEPHPTRPTTSDQVCDRCRRRKIRCRGDAQECSPCLTAGVVCVRSAKLQRNRKRKSFYENEGLDQRRPGGEASRPHSHTHSHSPCSSFPAPPTSQDGTSTSSLSPSSNTIPELRPFSATRVQATNTMASTAVVAERPAPPSTRKPTSEPIIGHMGRLVNDDQGVAMFAGSTTGVHFVSQAEQQVQMLRMNSAKFPSCVYSLHLHDLWGCSASSQQTPDADLIRAIVSQLPLDAEAVLLSAIERWTPIYPIVHKTTTIEAFRTLVNESTPAPDSIVVLHQVLGLLALGSLGSSGGQCIRNHYHFLCLSETHYATSATIIDKVLERPCLQTLQSLEIMQIYLQVSARYTMASHFGGIATRLAQSLGLHRHSHRFRFDPLETELRRRVWWCQYSLDTFSSAYHGLPRLIRNQDVDTDLPTSVDHDLLSRSHVAFPLPGEASQVDSALHLFKIAHIIGDTLENLYTTTKRRGGVAKISRLQAELDMWARSLPSSDPWSTSGAAHSSAPLESTTVASDGGAVPSESFASSFLRVVLCIATIQVHRPALSFTSPDPQSTASLHASKRASATLVKILSDGLDPQFVNSDAGQMASESPNASHIEGLLLCLLYPSGAHMLWQAGVTLLYAHWKLRLAAQSTRVDGSSPSEADDDETVQRCVFALRRLGDLTTERSGAHRLGQCAEVLDMLREKTFPQHPLGTQAVVAQDRLADGWDQVSWNVWDWPMESVLEFTNSMDVAPLDFFSNASPGLT